MRCLGNVEICCQSYRNMISHSPLTEFFPVYSGLKQGYLSLHRLALKANVEVVIKGILPLMIFRLKMELVILSVQVCRIM